MSRISSRQLYDNRDILTQILNLKDEIADEKVESIAFDRSGNRVTLNMTLGDGTVKSTYFDDNFVDSITSSQVGDVVTLKFYFKNGGPTKSVSFHVSGGGGSTPTYSAGTGITRTGDASTGYTFSIDETYTAKKSDLDAAKARVTQCEADITALDGRMTTAETDISGLASDMTTVQGDITTIQGAIGGSSTPGSIIYRLNSIEDGLLIPDTSSFTQDNSHYPTSLLVDSRKLDKPTATPTVGQLLAAGASGPEWVNPTPGAVIDTGMSDTSTNAVQNKVIKAYVDDVDDRVDAVEDEIGPEETAGTLRHSIKQNADAITDINTTIGSDILTPKTGMFKLIDDNDQAAVHKTGDETIEGVKTFTADIVNIKTGGGKMDFTSNVQGGIILKRDNRISDVAPSSTVRSDTISLRGNEGLNFILFISKKTDGKTQLSAMLRNSDGTEKIIVLGESDS